MLYTMPKFSTLIFSFLSILALFVFFLIFRMDRNDLDTYKKIVEEKSSSVSEYEGHQSRTGVTKNIWYTPSGKEERLHFKMISDFSELKFIHKNTSSVVVEDLSNVKCLMQESLGEDETGTFQQIRLLNAKEATYNYTSSVFNAESVFLDIYRIPGHDLPSLEKLSNYSPFLKGIAKTVTFTLEGGALNFEASQLKAHVLTQEES